MMNRRVEQTGVVAAILLALCCLTPVVFGSASVVSFAAVVGYLGFAALPAIALLALVPLYAVWSRHSRLSGEDPHH